MRLEHESAEHVKRRIREIVGRHLDMNQYQIFFFGSRVQGRGDERSDIDIGIDGPAPVPAAARFAIEDEIDALPILYKMEIVEFKDVSPDFRQEAMKAIEPIN